MKSALLQIGRGLGAVSGAALAVLWAYTMWTPSSGLGLGGIGLAIGFIMTVIAVIAVIAAINGHSTIVMIAFLASFLPVGATLIQAADLQDRWIGLVDLGLLVAAALIRYGSGAQQR